MQTKSAHAMNGNGNGTVAPPRRPPIDEVAINAAIAHLNLKVASIKDGTLYLNLTVPEGDIPEAEMDALPSKLVETLKRLPLYDIHTISFG